MNLHIDLDTKELNKLFAKISSSSLLVRIIHEATTFIANTTIDALVDEKSPYSDTKWKLAPSTIAAKIKKYNDVKKPLYASGNMSGSLRIDYGNHSATIALNAASKSKDGKKCYYAAVHQFGTNRAGRGRRTTIPARPFMPLTPDGEVMPQEIEKIRELIAAILSEI
ncbi:hypothetical protein FACS189487_10920 [Campylobacterota bacterium]|nr:hypothetical protein FACS189487_10920 [Campylobacterota bacterium]